MKVIINARIYDYKNYIENGYVVFDDEIIKVGDMKEYKAIENVEVIDFGGDLLLPSFVCSHAHIYSIFARGLALPFNPKNFQEILDQMWWKLDAKLTNELTYYSGIAASYEFLLNGVTSVIDHHASGQIIGSLTSLSKAVSKVANMRGVYCFETSDRYNVDECLKENISFAKTMEKGRIAGLFGMHASMSISDDTLGKIAAKAKQIPLHVHVAESKMDEDDARDKYSTNIISRFDKFGIISPRSLIVHGVFLSEQEMEIVSARKAYMVVNTTSNMNNAVGIPPVKKYLEHNIPVMVGNDGLNSNMASEYMNVYFSSHMKNDSPISLNLGDVLGMINNAYVYVSESLQIKLGKISQGYKADLLRVKYTPFTKMDNSNAFGHILFGLYPNFKPQDVFIDGKYQVKDYKVVNERLVEEFKKCKSYSQKLCDSLKEEK